MINVGESGMRNAMFFGILVAASLEAFGQIRLPIPKVGGPLNRQPSRSVPKNIILTGAWQSSSNENNIPSFFIVRQQGVSLIGEDPPLQTNPEQGPRRIFTADYSGKPKFRG